MMNNNFGTNIGQEIVELLKENFVERRELN